MPLPPDLAELLRLPAPGDGTSALQHQLAAEGAANLGRLGRRLERSLAALQALDEAGSAFDAGVRARRPDLLNAAAEAAWYYFVQREACGITDHAPVIEAYAIPRDVLARVGAQCPPGHGPAA